MCEFVGKVVHFKEFYIMYLFRRRLRRQLGGSVEISVLSCKGSTKQRFLQVFAQTSRERLVKLGAGRRSS